MIPPDRSHRDAPPEVARLRAAHRCGARRGGRPARAAAAATPCWKALLNDWYDGRIDNTYPLHCYTDALKHLPADVQTYSSAHDDILRALQSAIAKLGQTGHAITPDHADRAADEPRRRATTTADGRRSTAGTQTTVAARPRRRRAPGRDAGNGRASRGEQAQPVSPSSLPVPLLVLGGLALLLVAAGAAGLVAKRIQARTPGP